MTVAGRRASYRREDQQTAELPTLRPRRIDHTAPLSSPPLLVVDYVDEQNTTRRFGGPDHFNLLVQTSVSSVDPLNTFCIC
jgi:hypothetical protein